MTLLIFIVLIVLAVLFSASIIGSAVLVKLIVDETKDKQDNKYYIWTLGFTVISIVLWLEVWAMMPVGGV